MYIQRIILFNLVETSRKAYYKEFKKVPGIARVWASHLEN
jgi:hypothetical protein